MRSVKGLFAAAATLVASALIVAQAGAVTLHVHNGGDPSSLDPHKVSGDWENRVVGDILEGLVAEDIDAKAIPGQAESWDISEDGLVYTFHLRDGIQWSDGTPVTADDFVFALQRLQDPANAAEYAYLQYPIKNAEQINSGEITDLSALGVKAIDDRTVEITLENPAPFFIEALTHYTAFPVPKHIVEAKGDDWVKVENIAVNGPYKPSEWLPGSHVKLVANDSYYGMDDLAIDEVIYYVLEDESAALRRYRAGEFDILTEFPTDQLQWLNENMPGEAHVAPQAGLYYYVFNLNRKPFDDARVRQALSMAINREVIGPQVLGSGEIPAYSWVPPGTANYGEPAYVDWKDLSYADKIAEATALLGEAGFGPDNPLKVELRYNTNENHKRVAVAIAAMWKALGVEVTLLNTEVKVHYADLQENDFAGVARAGWLADYNDPVNFLDLLKTGVTNNYGRWSNAEFDSLLDQAAEETDLEARAQLLFAAEKIAMEETAAVPIYYYVTRNMVSPKVSGFKDNVRDIHRTRWMSKTE
ncbi:MAG: peptide ABC transporter substrate-binding protein [Hyphomicrobiales bacterium]|nr:peptide ABC transporter substrate-binding protein [Hyphomicrobiales bacterium]